MPDEKYGKERIGEADKMSRVLGEIYFIGTWSNSSHEKFQRNRIIRMIIIMVAGLNQGDSVKTMACLFNRHVVGVVYGMSYGQPRANAVAYQGSS